MYSSIDVTDTLRLEVREQSLSLKMITILILTEKSDEEDEKKDEEKSYHEDESDEDPDVIREREDAAKYIVETYPPVIVTVHQDSYIRFWTMEVR